MSTMTADRIVIIGGGAAGVLAASALAASAPHAEVTVIERADVAGPGLAYGTARPHHLLNSPAGRMSADADDAGQLVDWRAEHGLEADPGAFTPRAEYGRYLTDVAVTLERAGRVRIVHAEARRITDDGVELADGVVLPADRILLALGTPPPSRVPAGLAAARTIPDPWVPGALDEIGPADRVLLVGTGLTAVDIATSLGRDRPGVHMTMTSRHLLEPRTHLASPHPAGPGLEGDLSTPGRALRAMRRAIATAAGQGVPWQAVVDGVRPQVNAIWASWSHESRERYIEHVSRVWEVHRHRMAARVRAELDELLRDGRLTIEHVDDASAFDVSIACTGPLPAARHGWNPVVDALLDDGLARADALGLGLAVDDDGALLTADGEPSTRIWAIGSARRGTSWETTAVPEIRQQAVAFATLVGARP